MRVIFYSLAKSNRPYLLPILLSTLLFSLTFVSRAQNAQPAPLSLADILIGLRSKKVTLVERNTLLTEAVGKRGITFGLTPEIEKELVNTGASGELVEAIRQKSPKITPMPMPAPKPEPTPVSTPTPAITPTPTPLPLPSPPAQDSTFFRTRATAHIVKAEYDLAVADFSKAIELSPKESMAYFNRGDSYEKMGDFQKAIADFQKAVELDPNNEPAKNNLQRLQAEQAKVSTEQKKKETSPSETKGARQTVELGQLNGLAVKLVKPIYPEIARKENVQGTVTVQVTLDEEGNVTSVKATSGQMLLRSVCEEAAYKSKFKPARIGDQAVKATGLVVYNFSNLNK